MKELNVVIYDFNKKDVKFYDVVPYFCNIFDKSTFKSRHDLKNAVVSKGKQLFWSRCEWEMTIGPWPERSWTCKMYYKTDGTLVNIKDLTEAEQLAYAKETQKIIDSDRKVLDVWVQIESNIELLLDILEPLFVKNK